MRIALTILVASTITFLVALFISKARSESDPLALRYESLWITLPGVTSFTLIPISAFAVFICVIWGIA